jgi:hypothetical protein
MSNNDVRTRADARLDQAAAAMALADPRPPLRQRLRDLKESNTAGFERARAHYDQTVVPALADEGEPLQVWVDYARFLGELASPGRLMAIDGSGLATPYRPPSAGELVLFVPDDTAAPVLVALAPASPTAAQQATNDLLVRHRLSL